MKIALVSPDGLSVLLFCKGIISALKRIPGVEVVVLSSDGVYKRDIEALGIRSISIDIYRFISPVKDIKLLLALVRIFRQEKFDIVINCFTKPNLLGSLAAKLAKVKKIILHVNGLGSVFLPNNDIKSRALRYVTLKLYRLSCSLCNKIWFTNKNDLAYFMSQNLVSEEKVVLTKFFLDVDYYSSSTVREQELSNLRKELDIDTGDKVVVMVARMIWPKGIKEFVEASNQLKDKFPHLKFLLVAPLESGSPNSVPEAYVREQEKCANFRWLGFRRDVKEIYALSNLAVLPSYYKEGGYPRALTEPMAMGKPIITTNTPDCRETVEEGKNGLLIPVKDSMALATAIEELIADEHKSLEFGKYSRVKAERDFDEKKIVPQALAALGFPLPSMNS